MTQAAAHGQALDGERWCLVRVRGDLDLASEPALARVLEELAQNASHGREQHHQVVLDLASVTFLDCRGLRPIIDARRRLADRFWLANPTGQVTRLLALVGLAEEFGFLPGSVPTVQGRRPEQRRSQPFVVTVVHDEQQGVCGYCGAVLPVTFLSAPSAAASGVVLCPPCHDWTSAALVCRPRQPSRDS